MLPFDSNLAKVGAVSAGIAGYTFAKGYRELSEPIPSENNVIYNRTYGGPISSLGASLGGLLGSTFARRSPFGAAMSAGLGAFGFGVVGDVTHTKLPAESIILANLLTGTAVTAASLVANKYVPSLLSKVGDFMAAETAGATNQVLKGGATKLGAANATINFLKGKGNILGIGRGALVRTGPAILAGIMHAHNQLAFAGAARKIDTKIQSMNDNTNDTLTPANINPGEDVRNTTGGSLSFNQNISGTYSPSNINIR